MDGAQEASAAGVQPATVRSVTCVWTARAEVAGAALRDAADSKPVAEVQQLVLRAHDLGHVEAIAYARSAVAARVQRCLVRAGDAVQLWMAQLPGACPDPGCEASAPACMHACRPASAPHCLIALASAASMARLVPDEAPSGGLRPAAGGAGGTGCGCHVCSVTQSVATQRVDFEQLGLKQAAAATHTWLRWYVGRLIALHVLTFRFSTVSWDYFGSMAPVCMQGPEQPAGHALRTDICLQALAAIEQTSAGAAAVDRQPVVSSEQGRLLGGLEGFQAAAVVPCSHSSLQSQVSEPENDAGTRPECNGDACDAQELTPELLQAFAGPIRFPTLAWQRYGNLVKGLTRWCVQVARRCRGIKRCMCHSLA